MDRFVCVRHLSMAPCMAASTAGVTLWAAWIRLQRNGTINGSVCETSLDCCKVRLGTYPSIDLSCLRGERRTRLYEIGCRHVLKGKGSLVAEMHFADNRVESMSLASSVALLLDSDGHAA